MQRHFNRPALEYLAVIWEIFVLGIAAVSFTSNPNVDMMQVFSRDLSLLLGTEIHISNTPFAVGCVVSIGFSLLVLRARDNDVKRWLYTTAVLPLIAYVLPVGWYAYSLRRPGLGPIAYIILFVPFIIIAFATFREVRHVGSSVDVSAAVTADDA